MENLFAPELLGITGISQRTKTVRGMAVDEALQEFYTAWGLAKALGREEVSFWSSLKVLKFAVELFTWVPF